jgi:hypothetical protein
MQQGIDFCMNAFTTISAKLFVAVRYAAGFAVVPRRYNAVLVINDDTTDLAQVAGSARCKYTGHFHKYAVE